MRYPFLFFAATLLSLQTVHGQGEKINTKVVTNQLGSYYNSGKYDSIFLLYSINMQKASPIDQTVDFFTKLKSQSGIITNKEFKKCYGNIAFYKTNFERALLIIIISVNDSSKIDGLYIKPYPEDNTPIPERNITKLKLPFEGKWIVTWGGDTKELNYHVSNPAQKNAFDILIKDEDGNTHRSAGNYNEDYYAFGKKIIAPCDGEVVLVVNGVKDNLPGDMNKMYLPGNSIIIKTEEREFLVFCHFKQNSIEVKQGQKVKQGQLLGLCGNSGNSSEPHLHFHIQNIEDMNSATGIKCFFDGILVNGILSIDYSPSRGDKISNIK